MKKTAVVGGGASGIMAAITAADNGAEVTLYERNDRIGKKILSTGNGKCNFSNTLLNADCYYGADKEKLHDLFDIFSMKEAVSFFESEGMLIKDKNGYLYPLSEQASTVIDILRLALYKRNVKIVTEARITDIHEEKRTGGFMVAAGDSYEHFDSVVIACGGLAAPKTGSDGDGFAFAQRMGHSIIPVVPALVQLRCKESFFKMIAGVRCDALISIRHGNNIVRSEQGELQLTDYGISGIPVFQLSRTAAYLLQKEKTVAAYIDFFPQYSIKEYEELCEKRMQNCRNISLEEFLLGIANKKINLLFIKLAGLRPKDGAAGIGKEKLRELLYAYRKLCVHVTGTNSFENAQVSAGGVSMKEVSAKMESVIVKGIFFAGEVLDIDGRCGGYNLQWAWTSGYIAGKNAAIKE